MLRQGVEGASRVVGVVEGGANSDPDASGARNFGVVSDRRAEQGLGEDAEEAALHREVAVALEGAGAAAHEEVGRGLQVHADEDALRRGSARQHRGGDGLGRGGPVDPAGVEVEGDETGRVGGLDVEDVAVDVLSLGLLRAGRVGQAEERRQGTEEEQPARHRCYARGYPIADNPAEISSRIEGSSIVAGAVHGTPSAIFFTVPRTILPERVLGSRFTTIADLNDTTGPICRRTSSTSSATSSARSRSAPALSTTRPSGTSPLRSSTTPTTAHSAISGCDASTSSILPVLSRWPATLITSSVRPMIQR